MNSLDQKTHSEPCMNSLDQKTYSLDDAGVHDEDTTMALTRMDQLRLGCVKTALVRRCLQMDLHKSP